jgi:hypothetical protein
MNSLLGPDIAANAKKLNKLTLGKNPENSLDMA